MMIVIRINGYLNTKETKKHQARAIFINSFSTRFPYGVGNITMLKHKINGKIRPNSKANPNRAKKVNTSFTDNPPQFSTFQNEIELFHCKVPTSVYGFHQMLNISIKDKLKA